MLVTSVKVLRKSADRILTLGLFVSGNEMPTRVVCKRSPSSLVKTKHRSITEEVCTAWLVCSDVHQLRMVYQGLYLHCCLVVLLVDCALHLVKWIKVSLETLLFELYVEFVVLTLVVAICVQKSIALSLFVDCNQPAIISIYGVSFLCYIEIFGDFEL